MNIYKTLEPITLVKDGGYTSIPAGSEIWILEVHELGRVNINYPKGDGTRDSGYIDLMVFIHFAKYSHSL